MRSGAREVVPATTLFHNQHEVLAVLLTINPQLHSSISLLMNLGWVLLLELSALNVPYIASYQALNVLLIENSWRLQCCCQCANDLPPSFHR